MTARHVLIDLDGTVSDSSPGIARSLQHAFTECGYEPPTDSAVRTIIGPPFEVGLPRLGIPHGDVNRVALAYRERYEDVGLFENEIYAGVPEMLRSLGELATLAVATAKPETTAARIVEHFELDVHFEGVFGATIEVGSHRRTKSQVITHALSMLSASGRPHTVMLGDRDHDVEGALDNGIDCVGVTWGFGSRAELLGAGAAATVDSPADVVAALSSTYRGAER